MKPDRADAALLIDIVNHARRIGQFVEGQTLDTFLANAEKQAAVAHHIMVIGEIVRRLSEPFTNAQPSISWANIATMRNRLIHDYDGVDLEILWIVATERVPELHRYLSPLVPIRLSNAD